MRRLESALVALVNLALVLSLSAPGSKSWLVSTPQAVGLDPKVLAGLDADIAAGKYGYIDSMLVIRDGKLVYDRSYPHDYGQIYGKEAKEPGRLTPMIRRVLITISIRGGIPSIAGAIYTPCNRSLKR